MRTNPTRPRRPMTRLPEILARIAVGAAILVHLAGAARAADVTVMCPPPMRGVGAVWRPGRARGSGRRAAMPRAPRKETRARLEAGEKADVVVLTAAAADGLIKAGKVARRVELAHSTIGVAVPMARRSPTSA